MDMQTIVLIQHATARTAERIQTRADREHQAQLYYRLGLDVLREFDRVVLVPGAPERLEYMRRLLEAT